MKVIIITKKKKEIYQVNLSIFFKFINPDNFKINIYTL